MNLCLTTLDAKSSRKNQLLMSRYKCTPAMKHFVKYSPTRLSIYRIMNEIEIIVYKCNYYVSMTTFSRMYILQLGRFSSCKLNYIFRGIVLFQKKVSNSCKINVLLNATNIFFVCSYFSNLAHIIDVTCTCHY